ncbi:MAG: glycosyltransferase family 2 protein [Candidatus Scalindua sp.]|jgi:GT2 family glycosyltransferase|nr:glycosyltransferase family 2 protein [Candidatus Scalindua sp.]MBT6229865.1 glycosyltransferase family 2 protein [Candidatus Scalindua sp.]
MEVSFQPTINIIILNYNGRDLLAECLPSIVVASHTSKYSCKVTVIDNVSTDDSVQFLRSNFPDVDIVRAKENLVLCSYNDVIQSLDDDIVILLNNDLKLDKNYVDPLVSVFSNQKDVFFVASRGYSFDGVDYEGDRAIAKIRWGILNPETRFKGYERFIKKSGYTISAGIAAFDRKKFIELGGYDDLYLPGRYEDVDLCFRGWKRGWKGIYQPESVQFHMGCVSFKKNFKQKEIDNIVFRNSILFTIKNITSIRLWIQFSLFLFLRLGYFLICGKWGFFVSFYEALRKLPLVLERRKKIKKMFFVKDLDILKKVNEGITT